MPSASRISHPARLVAVLALALPATAIAAPTAGEGQGTPDRPDRPERGPAPVALVSGYVGGLTVEPEPAGPFHPVDAPVDYGSAEASFGNERGRPHEGQDVFAPAGTQLISPTRTEVLETGGGDDRGNWAALYDVAADRTYVYFHMLGPAEVEAGQRLDPGDRVGEVGCTGSCYGEHLHFEIREGRDPYGTATDPLPELLRWERLPAD